MIKRLTRMIFRRPGWRFWRMPGGRKNYAKHVGDGTNSSTVMAPLLWIGRTFPEAPPALWRKLEDGQEEQDAEHDILRLLDRPTPHYSGAVLWMATIVDWYVNGDAYWLKVRNTAGAVKELWWTPSTLIEPKGDEREFISHYEYSPDGEKVVLEPEDVVHFRYGMDPEDSRHGLSPLKSVLREVFTDDEAAAFTASLLGNMGVPGLVVSPKGDAVPSADDAAAVKEYVRDATTGDNRGDPLVMSGPTEVKQFGFSPEQLSLKDLRRIPEERVSAVLGVPAIVAGLGAGLDRSTFANMSEAREMAYESNIIPAQRIIGSEIQHQLLSDFEEDPWAWRVGFDLKAVRVLQEDENKKADRMSAGVAGGWVKVSEARREFDFEVEDTDEVYLRSVATVEVGDEGRPEPPAPDFPPQLGPEDPEVPEDPAAEGEAPEEIEEEEEEEAKGLKSHQAYQRRLMQLFDRDERVLSVAFEKELTAIFDELGEMAESSLRSLGAGVLDEGKANGGPPEFKISDEVLAQRVLEGMQLEAWSRNRLRRAFGKHWRRTGEATVASISSAIGVGLELSDALEMKLLQQGGTRAGLVDVTRSTRDAIRRGVASGRELGEGFEALARRIRSDVPAGRFVNAGPEYRAQLISRTETKYAQNQSSLSVYRDADTISAVIAFDARLGDSDEDCMERDGQTFTFDEAEAQLALEHPNGTLSFAPVVAPTVRGNA